MKIAYLFQALEKLARMLIIGQIGMWIRCQSIDVDSLFSLNASQAINFPDQTEFDQYGLAKLLSVSSVILMTRSRSVIW
jgi:hypothetical protein